MSGKNHKNIKLKDNIKDTTKSDADQQISALADIASRQQVKRRRKNRHSNLITIIVAIVLLAVLSLGLILLLSDKKCTINFYIGTDIVKTIEIKQGEKIPLDLVPEVSESILEFDGLWYTNARGVEGYDFDFSRPIQNNLNLYAGLTIKVVTLKVHVNDGSGSTYAITGRFDELINPYNVNKLKEQLSAEYEQNYTLLGFDINAKATTPEYTVSQRINIFEGVLYAIWEGVPVEIELTSDNAKTIEGNSFESELLSLNYGEEYIVNTAKYSDIYEKETGARVQGINVIQGGISNTYTNNKIITISHDMQFELAFFNEINKLTINFDNGEEDLVYLGVQEITMPQPTIFKEHYTLTHYNGTSGNIPVDTSLIIEGELYYKAVWQNNIYTITLDSNDSNTQGSQYIYLKYDDDYYVDLSATNQLDKIILPTKTGYNFIGYFAELDNRSEMIIDASGNVLSAIGNTHFKQDATIYAHYEIKTFDIAIENNIYGTITPLSETTVEYNNSFTFSITLNEEYTQNYAKLLAELQKQYATVTAVNGENEVYMLNDIAANITLSVPKLTINNYTITWINWDGRQVESIYAYGETPTAPNFSRQSDNNATYNFLDWDKDIQNATTDALYYAKYVAVVDVPVIVQDLVYNKDQQMPDVVPNDYYEINVSAKIDAGIYDDEDAVKLVLISLQELQLTDSSIIGLEWADSNYVNSDGDVVLEWRIHKAILTAPTATNTTFEYNGVQQTLPLDNFDSETMIIASNVFKHASDYTAVISLKDSVNYKWASDAQLIDNKIEIDWQITKANLKISATNIAIIFESELPVFNENKLEYLIITGFKGTDSKNYLIDIASDFHLQIQYTEEDFDTNNNLLIGEYYIVVTGALEYGDYIIEYVSGENGGKLIVTEREIAKPLLENTEFEYIGNTITPTIINLIKGAMQVSESYEAIDVGKYTLVIELDANYKWQGSEVGEENQLIILQWEITPALLTVTAENKTKIYGTQNPDFTYVVSGLLGKDINEDINNVINASIVLQTTADENSSVSGSPYSITFATTLTAKNYNVTLNNGVLNVTADIIDAPTATKSTFTYNGNEKTLELSGFNEGTMHIINNKNTNVNINEYGEEVAYIATIMPISSNYIWADGTITNQDGNIEIEWYILKSAIEKPTVTSNLVYNGKSQSPTITPVNNSIYTITVDSQIQAGTNYTATINLIDVNNYKWLGDDSMPLTLNWSIAKYSPVHTQSGIYQYMHGQPLKAINLNDYEVANGVDGELAGEFAFVDEAMQPTLTTTTVQIVFTANDTDNYEIVTFGLSISVVEIGVTFESNGGSAVDTLIQKYGTEIIELPITTRTHYNFAGWYLDDALNNKVTLPYTLVGNVTFYAYWTPVEYTVSFSTSAISGTQSVKKPNDNNTIIIDDMLLDYGDSYTFDLVNDNIFAGLFEKSTGKAVVGLQVNGTGTVYTSAIPVTGDLILNFVFAPVADKVIIDYNGGSISGIGDQQPSLQMLGKSTNIQVENVKKQYYTLLGYATENVVWNNENLGSTIALYTTTQINGMQVGVNSITYYAIWKPIFVYFNYHANGGSGVANGDEGAVFGTNNFMLATVGSLTREFYTFTGWAKSSDGSQAHAPGATINLNDVLLKGGTYILSDYQIDDSQITITLYAYWTRNQTRINYNYGVGSGSILTNKFDTDTTINTLTELPTGIYEGYDFDGWSLTSGGMGEKLPQFWQVPVSETTLYARWTPKAYVLVRNGNGGTSAEEIAVTFDAHYNLGTSTRTGYIFNGWFTSESGGTKLTDNTGASLSVWKVTNNITVYAQWTANTYTVIFDKYSGTGGSNYVTATFDSAMPSATAPTRTGYKFIGYYDATSGGVQYYTATMASARSWDKAENTTLYARWTANTYIITRDSHGGNLTGTVSVTYDENYNLGEPIYTGYTFNGWFTSESGGSRLTDNTGESSAVWTGTSNITAHAQWTVNTYSVTLNKQNGTGGSNSITATYDSAMPSATAPTRTGYTFAGYYDATSGGVQYYTASMESARSWNKAEDTTLYARWTARTFTVTRNSHGGNLSGTVTVTYDDGYNLGAPTRTGYTFNGWFTSESGGTRLTSNTGASSAVWTGTSDITAHAQWTARTFTITRNSHGGNLTGTVSVTYNENYNLGAPTRTGYTFNGWFTSESGGSRLTSNTGASSAVWTGTNDITAHAQWAVNTYSVTLNKQNGTGGSNSITATYDSAMPSATAPTRTGYTFAGYYDATSGGVQYYTATMASARLWNKAEDTTLYARWTARTFTITRDSQGGNLSGTVSVTYDDSYNLGAPTRTGYTFNGWFTSESGGLRLTSNTGASSAVWTGTSNITAYAQWTARTYTVTRNSHGGNSLGAVTVTYDESYNLGVPTRTGYTFNGWFTSESGGSRLTSNTGASSAVWTGTSNITAHAQWTVNTYSVTLNKQNGTGGSSSVTATYDSAMPSATAPTRTGYTFAGYYDATSGGVQYYTATMASARSWNKAEDTTLYARWTARTYTVTRNSQGGNLSGTVTVTYGENYNLDVPTRTGYSFNGWFTSASGGSRLTSNTGASSAVWTGTSNITAHAQWTARTYTVTRNSQGGNLSGTIDVIYNQNYNLGVPARTGYSFNGWFTSASGGTRLTNASGESSAVWTGTTNISAHAQWTARTYTITRNSQGGNLSGTVNVTYSQSYNLGVPTRTGYTFNGWFTSASGGTRLTSNTGASSAVWTGTDSITAHAQWTARTYTVTLNKQNGTGGSSSVTATYNSAMPSATAPTRTGYTFAGYYDATSGGVQYYTSTMASARSWNKAESTTLYARWTARTYTITRNSQGGNLSGTVNVTYNESYNLGAPTRTGYTFNGWFTSASAGTRLTSNTGASSAVWTGTSNITAHAQWTARTYTVTRNSQGGNLSGTVNVTYNASYNLGVPTRTGYTFNGWFTSASGGTRLTSNTGASSAVWTGTSNITAHAQWTGITYTATLDKHAVTATMVSVGDEIPSKAYDRDGELYAFIPAQSQTITIEASMPTLIYIHLYLYDENMNQLARSRGGGIWPFRTTAIIDYNVTANKIYYFVLNSSSEINNATVSATITGSTNGSGTLPTTTTAATYGSSYNLGTLSRENYNFVGWFTAKTGGTQVATSGTWNYAGNRTLYARFTAKTYTITFNANGGSVSPASRQISYNGHLVLPTPTRSGYDFDGWYTERTGGSSVATNYRWTGSASTTIYARWTSATCPECGSTSHSSCCGHGYINISDCYICNPQPVSCPMCGDLMIIVVGTDIIGI